MHFEPDSPPMLIGRPSLACETTLCASGFHLEIIPVSPIHLPSTVKLEVLVISRTMEEDKFPKMMLNFTERAIKNLYINT